jgi:hypothetical protein
MRPLAAAIALAVAVFEIDDVVAGTVPAIVIPVVVLALPDESFGGRDWCGVATRIFDLQLGPAVVRGNQPP